MKPSIVNDAPITAGGALSALSPEVRKIRDAIEQAIDGMTAAELGWTPAPEKWSAANILEHLSITFAGSAKVMHKSISDGPPRGAARTLWQRAAVFVVTGLGVMPGGRKAPPFTVPSGTPPELALAAVRLNLARMDEAFTLVRERFAERDIVGAHPVLGPLTLAQWEKFHLVHTRHHMKQIAALRERIANRAK